MIVDIARGDTGVLEDKSLVELDLAEKFGLKRYSFRMQDWNTVVNVYVNGMEIKDIGYHAVQGKGVKHLLQVVEPDQQTTS